jgi:hypothetical protein
VEYWIVKAISSKILDCKVDQLNQFVIVRYLCVQDLSSVLFIV